MFGNPRTTIAAIMTAVSALMAAVAMEMDGDPETHANWAMVVPLFITALGLLFAKDGES